MAHQTVKTDISKILDDSTLSTVEKIGKLERMREGARAEMRAATESAMVNDNDVGDDLKLIDQALDDLAAPPDSIEDGGGATL
ncbi:hypothetical protein PZ897_00025 [Hoeflea sp. YIM 152468]|uniref:hypothetical protein n=1 Tax=Hoeflea sp. YIM 152468 TaxID=3031759 RepID=UPI0023DBB458|nr:hypothetical protein [Hoeflea sp. YIM 152468]MDF1606553.1 hypothetical protein [Hoeflea sp. YIM 152468]